MNIKNNPMWSFSFLPRTRGKNHAVLDILTTTPLFEGLARRELGAIAEIVHQRSYEENEFVFRKGQPGAAMFIIVKGTVDIIDHDRRENDALLASLGERAFFGELALLEDSPRSASALAKTDTSIYAFFRADLARLFKTCPQIGLQVYRSLAMIIGTRLKVTNEQLFNQRGA